MLKVRHLFPVFKNHLSTCAVLSSESSNSISFRRYDEIAFIGIDRPAKRNALDEVTLNRLKDAVVNFENDDALTIGVIHGEGGSFCSGLDLKELSESDSLPKTFIRNDFTAKYVKKPLIAAINGYAVGFGFDLAIWCDLRVMDETAVLGCFGRRYGASMSETGIGRLHAIVGLSKAMELIMTGRWVKSEEALQCGLVNRVVSCGTAVGQALNLATSLIKHPMPSMLADRAVLYKHAFAKIPLKNSFIENEAEAHKEQILEDSKRGAKLFVQGHGKNGELFPNYLWKKSSQK